MPASVPDGDVSAGDVTDEDDGDVTEGLLTCARTGTIIDIPASTAPANVSFLIREVWEKD